MKYKTRLRSRISNLKDQKNPELRRNVLCGNITPQRIATMSAEVSTKVATGIFSGGWTETQILSPDEVPEKLLLPGRNLEDWAHCGRGEIGIFPQLSIPK